MIASAMLTAIFAAHLHEGWFPSTRGPERPLTNLAAFITRPPSGGAQPAEAG